MTARKFWIWKNKSDIARNLFYARQDSKKDEPRWGIAEEIHVIEKTAYDSLTETLKDAMRMISSEYCSHKGECSSKAVGCYVQKYHKVLEGGDNG